MWFVFLQKILIYHLNEDIRNLLSTSIVKNSLHHPIEIFYEFVTLVSLFLTFSFIGFFNQLLVCIFINQLGQSISDGWLDELNRIIDNGVTFYGLLKDVYLIYQLFWFILCPILHHYYDTFQNWAINNFGKFHLFFSSFFFDFYEILVEKGNDFFIRGYQTR